MANREEKTAVSPAPAVLTVIPAPRLSLHNLEAVRRELGRVYRDARAGLLPTADAARLTYMLGELRKLHEAVEIEQRLAALESSVTEIDN